MDPLVLLQSAFQVQSMGSHATMKKVSISRTYHNGQSSEKLCLSVCITLTLAGNDNLSGLLGLPIDPVLVSAFRRNQGDQVPRTIIAPTATIRVGPHYEVKKVSNSRTY